MSKFLDSNGLVTYTNKMKEYINSKVENSRSDWNENDPDSVNYIVNRPFHDNISKKSVVLKPGVYTGTRESIGAISLNNIVTGTVNGFVEGDTYDVVYGGQTYENVAVEKKTISIPSYGVSFTYLALGNFDGIMLRSLYGLQISDSSRTQFTDNDIPFCMAVEYSESQGPHVSESSAIFAFFSPSLAQTITVTSTSDATATFTVDIPAPPAGDTLDWPYLRPMSEEDFTFPELGSTIAEEIGIHEGDTTVINFDGTNYSGVWTSGDKTEYEYAYLWLMEGYDSNTCSEQPLIASLQKKENVDTLTLSISVNTSVNHTVEISYVSSVDTLDSKYIPTATSISDGETGFVTGDQVYDALQNVSSDKWELIYSLVVWNNGYRAIDVFPTLKFRLKKNGENYNSTVYLKYTLQIDQAATPTPVASAVPISATSNIYAMSINANTASLNNCDYVRISGTLYEDSECTKIISDISCSSYAKALNATYNWKSDSKGYVSAGKVVDYVGSRNYLTYSSLSYYARKEDLSTVATTGKYNDLINKPPLVLNIATGNSETVFPSEIVDFVEIVPTSQYSNSVIVDYNAQ